MRLHHEFSVAEDVAGVWEFFEQAESVARCMPGVEHVSVLDEKNIQLQLTQKIGPVTATFDTRVTMLERDPERLIRFRADCRSVRAGIGSLRTDNTVQLSAFPGGTTVAVDSAVVLAGVLSSVGHKVISKQAAKVTAEFAANLQRALDQTAAATAPAARSEQAGESAQPLARHQDPERRSVAAGVLSGVSAAVSVFVLVRELRRAR